MSAEFVHLHVHSQYSLVDGLPDIKPLFATAAEHKMPALAVTDESNLFAAIKFYRAGLAQGVKPIFGADIWVRSDEDKPTRLTLLCQNNTGYQNLGVLISQGFLDGSRYQGAPLIRRAWLSKKSLDGLIALSGCHQGDIGQAILSGHPERAKTWLSNWLRLFPDNRFYIELQRTGKQHDTPYIDGALALAQEQQVPVVATQDVRFLKQTDFAAHEIRVAIHDGYVLEDPNRPKNYTDQQYLASVAEMVERFRDIPSAIANTVEIAKRCTVTMELDNPVLPCFPVPEGMTESDYLIDLSQKGLEAKWPVITAAGVDPHKKAEYEARLKVELDVIINMGFPGYFLIVADFIQWAKQQGIPVGPGRGSGAGSLVAYVLQITDLDPLPYDLLFERFLNPERVSMPDFDIDFCMDGRDRVIDYVAERYGRDAVSQIVTFGSMAAKAVIRDVGRVLGHGYGFVDSIAKLVPFEIGMTLSKALEQEPLLKQRYDQEDEVTALIDMALQLEGTVRNVGKHAGGVVISPSKLTDFCAIYCEQGSQQLVTQFDKNDVESAGLVKFDFLGLRNLTIIQNTVDIVNAVHHKEGKEPIDINTIPLDDKATFDLLKRCETTAVFQLESRGMKDLIKRLQPDSFEEIIALVALFRPGPLQSGMVDDFINRKHGRAEVEYPHPDTEEILKPTNGIILYQEQVMILAQVLAGYTLGGADLLRRAMGKKKPEEMAKQRSIFTEGAIKNGLEEKTATYIFDLMEKFAGYGFNKSHSAAYALVAYQTAWLKAHHPAAFMAAVLSSDMDNTDKVVNFIDDTQSMGIAILPPDINVSCYPFTVERPNIRFGLGAIKGVGEAAIELIVAERHAQGDFADLFDFCRRLDLRKVNRRVIEALIDAGAFDTIAPNRASLMASLEEALKAAEQHERDQSSGQHDLFGAITEEENPDLTTRYVDAPPLPDKERLLREKDVLGCFISGHPMKGFVAEFKQMHAKQLTGLRATEKGKTLRIAGMVTQSRRIKAKSDKIMRIVTLDDSTASVEVVLFSDLLEQAEPLLQIDHIVVMEVEVRPDHFTGGLRSAAKEVLSFGQARQRFAKRLTLQVHHEQAHVALPKLHALFQQTEEGCPVVVHYHGLQGTAHLQLANACQLGVSEEAMQTLRGVLSQGCVEIEY